jgi:hypothetical protein
VRGFALAESGPAGTMAELVRRNEVRWREHVIERLHQAD